MNADLLAFSAWVGLRVCLGGIAGEVVSVFEGHDFVLAAIRMQFLSRN